MKKTNNWKLIGLLAGLALVFWGIRIFRAPLRESNLPQNLTAIDTAKVTMLVIAPARERSSEVRLMRSNNKWELRKGEKVARLEQGAAVTALRSLMKLSPKQIVSRKKEKWNEFHVGDSTGTHVRVMDGDDVAADIWIGKTGFSQDSGGMFGGGGFTYVRLQGEKEVYTVEVFLEGQFNKSFDDWRDKTFTRLKRDSVDRIVFHYPADSSFTLEKRAGRWMLGQFPADSATVVTYLGGLEYKNLSGFADSMPQGDAPAYIMFEKNTRILAKIEGWPTSSSWILRSSFQPDIYFSVNGFEEIKDTWRSKNGFMDKIK